MLYSRFWRAKFLFHVEFIVLFLHRNWVCTYQKDKFFARQNGLRCKAVKDLSSNSILGAIQVFFAVEGSLARCFYCDCDAKLFGHRIRDYLIDNNSKVVAIPAKRQLANGLVESHWKVMVHMARAYLIEKQMPRWFWFYAITHAAGMMNAIPDKICRRLVSPFLLVHGVGHDPRTWVPIFSLCYFHHKKDGDISWSKHQAHTMHGIIAGCLSTSNALLVYNPRNKQTTSLTDTALTLTASPVQFIIT